MIADDRARLEMSLRASAICDGLGAKRVAAAMAQHLTTRVATDLSAQGAAT
jgi:hypothetical protein